MQMPNILFMHVTTPKKGMTFFRKKTRKKNGFRKKDIYRRSEVGVVYKFMFSILI